MKFIDSLWGTRSRVLRQQRQARDAARRNRRDERAAVRSLQPVSGNVFASQRRPPVR